MDSKDPRLPPAGPTNERMSFGSNCLPHSQSQKISIGVLAEATQKLNAGVKVDEAAFRGAKDETRCRNLLEENLNNISSEQSRGKARNMELAGATVQEGNELNKEKQEENEGERVAQRSKEILRVKLSEILETASSPTKKSVSFETPSNAEKSLKREGHFHQNNIKAANSRWDADTIENDSVSPNLNKTTRRPVTRSLTKKKPTNKPKSVRMTNHTIGNRGGLPNSSIDGCGLKRRNIFSFSEEIWSQNIYVGSDVKTYTIFYKKGESNNGLEQNKNCAVQTTEKREREKTEFLAPKSISHGREGNFHDHLSRDDQKDLQSMNGVVKEIHNSPAKKRKCRKDVHHPQLRGKTDVQEDLYCFWSKNNEEIDFEDDNQHMGVETPIQNQKCSSYSSTPKRKQTEHSIHSPAVAEKRPKGKDFCSFTTFWDSKASSFRFDVEPEFCDRFEEFKTPSIRKSPSDEEEKLSDGIPQSSAEQDIDSSEDPTIKKGPKSMGTPESVDSETSSFLLRSTKMPNGQKDVRTKEFGSPFSSLKDFAGTPQTNGLEGPLDAQNGDSLPRAVALFVSALERVRTNMKQLVIKKSAEVLASVAEETKLQLRSVESQIVTDVEKFTIIGESKRKTLEKKFQEQQECMSIMYERFKEDMNKHFKDSRTTLEEMGIYQREQKGSTGKLKSLHKKLLLQVEEGVGNQLSDAERKIMMIQKVARHKMLQLRQVIMEFLSEDD